MAIHNLDYYVFGTEEEALQAEKWISDVGGVPIYGINAETKTIETNSAKTERWAVPEQRIDGKWVFPVVPPEIREAYPDAVLEFNNRYTYTIEPYDRSWFPLPEYLL